MEIIVTLVVLGGLGLMIWLTTQSQRAQREELASLRGELDRRLSEGQQQVRSQLQQVTDLFGQVREGMGQLYEAAAKMAELGKSIGGLEQLLRAPKVRGNLGEQRLEQLLKDILPAETFALQHHFRDGQSVDAIIRLGGHIVPIDAKFPLDNYAQLVEAASDQERNAARRSFLRAVKGHIDKVTQYIRPNEETYDFAIVYLPAESIYYEAFVREGRGDEDLTSYAHNRHVFPVSPNTLYPYLTAIAMGLRGMQVEKNAQEVINLLGRLSGDFDQFRRGFDTLGTHLKNATAKHDELRSSLDQLDLRIKHPLLGEPKSLLAEGGIDEQRGNDGRVG